MVNNLFFSFKLNLFIINSNNNSKYTFLQLQHSTLSSLEGVENNN